MKSNYFIIHGSFGSPFVNWVPWLRKELEKDEYNNICSFNSTCFYL